MKNYYGHPRTIQTHYKNGAFIIEIFTDETFWCWIQCVSWIKAQTVYVGVIYKNSLNTISQKKTANKFGKKIFRALDLTLKKIFYVIPTQLMIDGRTLCCSLCRVFPILTIRGCSAKQGMVSRTASHKQGVQFEFISNFFEVCCHIQDIYCSFKHILSLIVVKMRSAIREKFS